MDDDDMLDGCSLDFTEDPTPDEDLPWVVLFASVPDEHGILGRYRKHKALEDRADEWVELFS